MTMLKKMTAACLVAACSFGVAASANAMSISLDPDKDGTMDMPEAIAAATRVFYRINNDGDKTLEAGELAGRVSKADLMKADPDSDGSLDLNEYIALVKERFLNANGDDDQTIDVKELGKDHGAALARLIR